MNRFKLVRVVMGSGWPSGHVAINDYLTYPNKPGGNEKCLTHDAQNAQELSAEIDGLIRELEDLRLTAPAYFERWNGNQRIGVDRDS